MFLLQVADEHSIALNEEHAATVTFTNPFSHPVTGVLTVAGAGLIQGKLQFRMSPLPPGGRVQQRITFIPGMMGMKMLQASLSFTNIRTTIRGFKMLSVSSV